MTETEWTQTTDTEGQSTHQQVSHTFLILEYPAYVIHRSPSTTHGCPYKLFAGWCSLQELLHSPPYSSAAFIHYFTSFLNAGYHLKLKQLFLTFFSESSLPNYPNPIEWQYVKPPSQFLLQWSRKWTISNTTTYGSKQIYYSHGT